jgi:hypothetical protein
MSGKKTKQARKQNGKVAKPSGSRTPHKDPARQRVSLQQVDNAFTAMVQQQQMLEKKVSHAINTLHQNDLDLKGGLDSAEFNLRAQQKVVNAIAIDVEHIHEMTKKVLAVLAPDIAMPAIETKMIDIELESAKEDKPAVVVRRVEWAYYHAEVDSDLKLLAEEEKKAQEEAAAEAEKQAAGVEAKEGATEPLPDKNPELPEGASVFGG